MLEVQPYTGGTSLRWWYIPTLEVQFYAGGATDAADSYSILKATRPSFASGLSKLIITLPFLQTHYLIGIVWYVSSSQSSHQAPRTQGVSLTSSIQSRINAYLESDGCLSLKLSSRQATPPPTKPHNNPVKNMKRLVKQKLL